MAIKSVSYDVITYVPQYGDNRTDPNPLEVDIHPLSRREADAYRKQIKFSQKKGFRGDFESNIRDVQKRQFTDNVRAVRNFLDGKTGEEIADVKQFYSEAPDDLIEEIFDAMLNASLLSEDDVKNSGSQSDSPSGGGIGPAEIAEK